GVRALPDFGPGLPNDHFLNFARAMQFNRRPAILRVAEAEPNILQPCGHTHAAPYPGLAVVLRRWHSPPVTIPINLPEAFAPTGFQHLCDADTFRNRRADRHQAAFTQAVLQA